MTPPGLPQSPTPIAHSFPISLPISLGSLVLLSGPPGCGKTTARRGLPTSLTVSSDDLRTRFFGLGQTLVDGEIAQRPLAVDDNLVFETMGRVVRSRLQSGLTTLVDATLISDKERKPFAQIAEELHVPLQVIIFDLPEAQVQQQNKTRTCPVPSAVVSHFFQRLQRDSRWPHTVVTEACELSLDIPTIPAGTALDAIGDVHGLADTLRQMLKQLGYDDALQHPEGRKLCFLGDLVDRGPQSLEVLDIAMAAVEQGHYCIRGNHDNNLLRGLWGERLRSKTTNATLHQLLQTDATYQAKVKTFLSSLPTFYRFERYVLCHGDLDWFDPVEQPGRDRMYGRRRIDETYDSDAAFRAFAAQRAKSATAQSATAQSATAQSATAQKSPQTQQPLQLIRGHIPFTSPGPGVFSLEENPAFGGPLVALRLPQQDYVRVPCAFDYEQQPPTLRKRLKPLVSQKLVKRVDSPCGQLQLYKYTPKAFFNPKVWGDYPELKLARGVVTGLHSEAVNQPFPRTFNYGEDNGSGPTTLPPDTEAIAVEKLNGFLVTTFLHPYNHSQVVTTCSGSFEGDYVDRAKTQLYDDGLYGRVLGWLRSHPDTTLLWEAIHKDDPHIIQYSADQFGLHLIGAGTLGGEFLLETELDTIAAELSVPRPSWFRCRFSQALTAVKTVQHEGFMIRLLDGSFALKLKSPYYLQTKFLSRMTEKKARFMFSNPNRFKPELDEALWPLVDWVSQTYTLEDWLAWSDVERRDRIQAYLEQPAQP